MEENLGCGKSIIGLFYRRRKWESSSAEIVLGKGGVLRWGSGWCGVGGLVEMVIALGLDLGVFLLYVCMD